MGLDKWSREQQRSKGQIIQHMVLGKLEETMLGKADYYLIPHTHIKSKLSNYPNVNVKLERYQEDI